MAQIAGSPATVRVDTSGSPYGVILKLATPTVIAMLTQSIVNEIDIIFFAHLPCPEASNGQAALFPSLIMLWIFGGSLSAISVGTQAFTARRFAERRHADLPPNRIVDAGPLTAPVTFRPKREFIVTNMPGLTCAINVSSRRVRIDTPIASPQLE